RLDIPRVASNRSFDWQISTGFYYASGKYGAHCSVNRRRPSVFCTSTGTTVLEFPATAEVQIDHLRLALTIPYVDIEGPGKFAGNLGIPVVVGPEKNSAKHRSGMGDVTVGAGWSILPEGTFFPAVEIAGAVKLPTANKGLGTGKSDFATQINVHKTVFPAF